MERMIIVDDIMSTDGDCMILGVKKMCYDVNFNNHAFKFFDLNADVKLIEHDPLFRHENGK